MNHRVARTAAGVLIVAVCAFGAASCKQSPFGNRLTPGLVAAPGFGSKVPKIEQIANDTISVSYLRMLHFLNSTESSDLLLHTQPWGDGRHIRADIGHVDEKLVYLCIGFAGSMEDIARIPLSEELAKAGEEPGRSLTVLYVKLDGKAFFYVVPFTCEGKKQIVEKDARILEVTGTPDGKDWQTRTLIPVE